MLLYDLYTHTTSLLKKWMTLHWCHANWLWCSGVFPDAVNSGAETCCTGLETANTGSVFGSEASSREVVAVG